MQNRTDGDPVMGGFGGAAVSTPQAVRGQKPAEAPTKAVRLSTRNKKLQPVIETQVLKKSHL